jgi:hypothetical protein
MSTYTQIHYHIVFGTKYRTPCLQINQRQESVDRLYQKSGGASQAYKLAGRVEGAFGRAWSSLR